MDKISFGGIKNLYIGKKTHSEYGTYWNSKELIKRGVQEFEDVLIKCDLVDDEAGKHLSEFKETLAKCRPCYQVNCINSQNPNHFKLLTSKFKVKGDTVHVGHTAFFINDYEIMLDERQILPLYSFMAKITRTIANSNGVSQVRKEQARTVNKAIHDKAVDYIDYRM